MDASRRDALASRHVVGGRDLRGRARVLPLLAVRLAAAPGLLRAQRAVAGGRGRRSARARRGGGGGREQHRPAPVRPGHGAAARRDAPVGAVGGRRHDRARLPVLHAAPAGGRSGLPAGARVHAGVRRRRVRGAAPPGRLAHRAGPRPSAARGPPAHQHLLLMAQTLSLRDVNRALLSRQLLLGRLSMPADEPGRAARVVQIIEHLVGLQAQAPFPPYYGLHSRLDGFSPGDLAARLTDRSVVRIALMRGTIHLVSARDCLPLRRLLQPVIERGMRGAFGKQLAGVDPVELAAAGCRLVEAEPMTFAQLGPALAAQWPDHPPAALAQGVRTYVPLVQVPPRAVWGRSGQSMHTSAEHWLGQRRPPGEPGHPLPAASPAELAQLVTRYLGAFGPATVRDVQAWSGLTGLKAVLERPRPCLVTSRDEQGAELFDLPMAPRPGADAPAPVRLTAEFDNLLLS